MAQGFPRFPILLLMAAACPAGCQPVRDELFVLEAQPAGQVAPPPPAGGSLGVSGGSSPPAAAGSPGSAGTSADPPVVTGPPLNGGITFPWTETIPGAGACQPGRFIGTFTCTIGSLLVPETLDGLVTVVLGGSSESQRLPVDAGQVLAYDANRSLLLAANLAKGGGGLDCSTRELEAELEPTPTSALPLDRQLAWLSLSDQPLARGTLRGNLDPNTQVIRGELDLVFEPALMCEGTFDVRASN